MEMGGLDAPGGIGYDSSLNVLRHQSIIVAQGQDGSSWEAISLEADHPDWQRLTFPPEITVSPSFGPDAVGLWLKGKSIDHVAAFSKSRGTWSKQHLLKPVEGEMRPSSARGMPYYQAGNDIYAFSDGGEMGCAAPGRR